jgi:WD40 repeat protein
VATASSDSTVKVWDASSGMLRSTLRGGSGHTIISCDISGGLVVGGGSDKTCRVWNLRTERMVSGLLLLIPVVSFDESHHVYACLALSRTASSTRRPCS